MSPVELVVSGIGFTEGPLWTHDGRLVVVSMSRGLIYEIDPNTGEAAAVAEPGGGPNGLAQSADGTIWIAQNGGRHHETASVKPAKTGVQRWGEEGVRDATPNGSFSAPNDCAVGPDGWLWFTDPRGEPFEGEEVPGRVCALDLTSGETRTIIEGSSWPNGLAFGLDPMQLFVAETRAQRIMTYRVTADGVSEPTVFADLDEGSPDGVALDAEGSLYVAAPDANAVLVFDKSGRLVETLKLGDIGFPTNVCFGGPAFATLFVTAAKGGAVLALERDVPGLTLLT